MPDPPWQLSGFHERLVDWVAREHPPPWLVDRVVAWLPTLALDPYHHAQPEDGGVAGGDAELRIVGVPDAVADGLTVVCSYWIDQDRRTARCNYVDWRADPPQAGH